MKNLYVQNSKKVRILLYYSLLNVNSLTQTKAPIIFEEPPYFIEHVQYELDSVQYLIFR